MDLPIEVRCRIYWLAGRRRQSLLEQIELDKQKLRQIGDPYDREWRWLGKIVKHNSRAFYEERIEHNQRRYNEMDWYKPARDTRASFKICLKERTLPFPKRWH